jgi:ribosomal-protein-alanine N-acetyltransferase
MKNLRFDALQESHIPAVMEIEKEANPSPWSEASFRNELGNEQSVFLVCRSGVDVLGFAGMWLVVDEAHITTVAVNPEHRRKGIGWALMVELLSRARTAGMTSSTLEVRAGNEAAVKLYEHLGYVVAARRKKYYPDNREDALVMWLHDLDSWEAPKRS